jgi:hypothetical protein
MNALAVNALPCILIPAFNDWESLTLLFPLLDRSLHREGRAVDVLIVDDGSTQPSTPLEHALKRQAPHQIHRVEVVRLARNLGHQRAIAIGLALRNARKAQGPTVIMDADGEDLSEHVPLLLKRLEETEGQVVFAQRQKRSESRLFRTLYRVYRLIQRVTTGHTIDFGNFSAVPSSLLPTLAVTSELWNHYPAAVLSARIPHTKVPCERGRRLAGRSRLGMTGLVLHGLGAMSVFAERIGVRFIGFTLVLAAILLGLIGAVVTIRFTTDWAVPGWATYTTGLLTVLLFQMLTLASCFTFIILKGRNGLPFVPARDYEPYVASRTVLYDRDDSTMYRISKVAS